MPGTFLQIDHITKRFGKTAISISFTLEAGSAIALLGNSGCGKSTTLKMIAGLITPDSGKIILNGEDITALPAAQRNIGMMFQDYALFPHLTVEDNIGYGLVSQGISKKESRKEAAVWLERFGLAGMEKRRIEHLSGGEKQRVALARTLAVKPSIILFDEPLTALDTNMRIRLRHELKDRQKSLGYAAVYVTHDLEEAQFLADQIIEMPQHK